MELQSHRDNAAILRAIAGPDGIIQGAEFDRLDAADGKCDGHFGLVGLTKDEAVLLKLAKSEQAPVTVRWAPELTGIDWDNGAIQEAYATFLRARWETWKAQGEEADCKTLALRMMEDFRIHYREKAGVELPDPIPPTLRGKWVTYTPEKPGPLTKSVAGGVRKDYAPHKGKPLLSGPNHAYQHIQADTVARHVTKAVTERDGKPTIAPYRRTKPLPEGIFALLDPYPAAGTRLVNPEALRAGDILFQNHAAETGHKQDQRIDHTMQVLAVERDAASGRVRKVVIAMGTYDDLKDFDGRTAPKIQNMNNYAFEVTITFDDDGDVSDCRIPWQSDPYLSIEPTDPADRIRFAYDVLGTGQHWIGVHRWR